MRIATESAKQSGRQGVMRIDELLPLQETISQIPSEGAFYLSTENDSTPISSFILHPSSFAFIGPEGGWTDGELALFRTAGLTGIRLTGTILRIETAAVAAAAIVACLIDSTGASRTS
jgi:16S rRNA (uracil1498-N3)-methyltransferase